MIRSVTLASLALMLAACNVGKTRVTGEGIPCSSSTQCSAAAEVCFLGECRGTSTALSTVLAEVRPPPGSGYGVIQLAGIDLRHSVLVNFNLEPSLTVAGAVSQALGNAPDDGTSPVSGANVNFTAALALIPDRLQQVSVAATSSGTFSTQLPVGTWSAVVVPPAPLPPLTSALGVSTSAAALNFLLPASGDLLRVQGQLHAGSATLGGARVLAVDAKGALLAAATTADSTGAFQLVLAPDAPQFFLRVGPPGDPTANAPVGVSAALLPNYAPVGPFSASSGQVSFDFGASPPSAALSGKVVDKSGLPVANARVYAISLDGQGYVLSNSAVSDANGAFALSLLAGQFAIEAAPQGDASAPGLSAETDLQLTASGASVPLVCPPRVQAQGTVLLSTGKPAPAGTQISATRLPDRLVTSRVAQTQPTDASGSFTLVADAGIYRLIVTPPATSGLASKVVEIDVEPATRMLPAIALSDPLQVVGTVSGVTGSGAGAPIAGATVEFFALDATGLHSLSLGSGLTDESGRYLAVLPDVQQP